MARASAGMKEWEVADDETDQAESGRTSVTHGNPENGDRKLGLLGSLRASLRRKGHLTSLSHRSKVKSASDLANASNSPSNSTHTHTPLPSPSLSLGSPLRGLSGFFQKKDGDSGGSPLKTPQSHSRKHSDTSVALGDRLLKKGASLRRSLVLGSRRHAPDSTANQEPLPCATEAVQTEQSTGRSEVTKRSEVRESYVFPEIPHLPLSVMQINMLIELEVFEEAHVNMLSLRQEFHHQQESLGPQASPVELAHLEKDLHLLYRALRDKMADIVRQSSALPARNKELLVHVARIVQEEERREAEGEAGGLGGWREAWREAVRDGVRDVLEGVHLDTPEHNTSWLAVHLGLLGKAIVENLERVKAELQGSYPPSFCVFDAYVTAWHGVVGEHLRPLRAKVTETKDSYALLNFICNQYENERIMGSERLRPEMRAELRSLTLEAELLDQIKNTYCHQLQEEVRVLLGGVIRVEKESFWDQHKKPNEHDDAGCPISPMVMDLRQMVAAKENSARTLSADLGLRGTHICLEELQRFPQQMESEFSRHIRPLIISPSSDLLDQCLWVTYHITYINSFSLLREHMEIYRDRSPDQVTQLSRELEGAELRLGQALLQNLKDDIRPHTEGLMTKNWLTDDEDFKQLLSQVTNLCDLCKEMRQPKLQDFMKQLHLLVTREYFSSLMRTTYSCKNRKNVPAAEKLQDQWAQLNHLFQTMDSTEEWLHPLGEHLSDIIGKRNESDITTGVLQPLVEDYPDIREKHLLAVLRFRGNLWGPERIRIQQRLSKLKTSNPHSLSSGGQSRDFFTHLQ